MLETFQAMIGRKSAFPTIMNNDDADMGAMITTFNTAVTETASEIIRKHCQKKQVCHFAWLNKSPPPPSCVPSDSVSQSATVSICPLCLVMMNSK